MLPQGCWSVLSSLMHLGTQHIKPQVASQTLAARVQLEVASSSPSKTVKLTQSLRGLLQPLQRQLQQQQQRPAAAWRSQQQCRLSSPPTAGDGCATAA